MLSHLAAFARMWDAGWMSLKELSVAMKAGWPPSTYIITNSFTSAGGGGRKKEKERKKSTCQLCTSRLKQNEPFLSVTEKSSHVESIWNWSAWRAVMRWQCVLYFWMSGCKTVEASWWGSANKLRTPLSHHHREHFWFQFLAINKCPTVILLLMSSGRNKKRNPLSSHAKSFSTATQLALNTQCDNCNSTI